MKEKVTYYAGLPGHFKDKEAMYKEDTSTVAQEWETDWDDSEGSSDVFIGPATEGDLLDYKENFVKNIENIRNSHSVFGKPFTPHFLLLPPVLLSTSYLQERMEKHTPDVSKRHSEYEKWPGNTMKWPKNGHKGATKTVKRQYRVTQLLIHIQMYVRWS